MGTQNSQTDDRNRREFRVQLARSAFPGVFCAIGSVALLFSPTIATSGKFIALVVAVVGTSYAFPFCLDLMRSTVGNITAQVEDLSSSTPASAPGVWRPTTRYYVTFGSLRVWTLNKRFVESFSIGGEYRVWYGENSRQLLATQRIQSETL